MSDTSFDTIVVGIGGMGSSTIFNLAQRGQRVLGIERFSIPNAQGSSHGGGRIFRLSQFAGAQYVPLAIRSLELWYELEEQASKKIFHKTGGLDCGRRDKEFIQTALKSCRDHGIQHEVLTAGEVMSRFPAISLPSDYVGVYQSDAGILNPELCITEYTNLAKRHGATIKTSEQLLEWNSDGESVSVRTDKGTYEAQNVVFTTGAWIHKVVPLLRPFMRIERAVAAWFKPKEPRIFEKDRLPIYIIEEDGDGCYGFPLFNSEGFRVGTFRDPSAEIDPDTVVRDISEDDILKLRSYVSKFLPHGDGEVVGAETCLYEFSSDEHFIIDFHPDFPNVSIAGGFSSYGFKFCSVIGEVMSEMVLERKIRDGVKSFTLDRFNS